MSKIKWKKKEAKKAVNSEHPNPNEETPENATPQNEPAIPEESTADASAEGEATIAQWQEALEKAVAQRDEYLALAQRTQADFANFRRRNQSVRTDAYDDGVRETLAALLPVIDNFERALNALGDQDGGALAEGVKMTFKQMQGIFQKLGLEPIDAKAGDPFDPEIHNAVMRGEGGEPGSVLDCFEKGYRVKGRIVRYASVKVCAE